MTTTFHIPTILRYIYGFCPEDEKVPQKTNNDATPKEICDAFQNLVSSLQMPMILYAISSFQTNELLTMRQHIKELLRRTSRSVYEMNKNEQNQNQMDDEYAREIIKKFMDLSMLEYRLATITNILANCSKQELETIWIAIEKEARIHLMVVQFTGSM